MAIDPNTPPPLPPQIKRLAVKRVDGSQTFAVTTRDAGRLLRRPESAILNIITAGGVDICVDPKSDETLVLIDSLWLLVPEEERRAGLRPD